VRDWSAVRQLEIRLHGATRAGDAARVGRTVYGASGPEVVQPADGPLRASGHYLEYLLRLAIGPRVHVRARAGLCRRFSGHVQRLPPATEGSELQPGPSARKDEGEWFALRAAAASGHWSRLW